MKPPAGGAHAAEWEQFQIERIAFFSDAIFAIAITLLVLEIKVPHVEPGTGEAGAVRALLGQAFKASGFLASFLVIGTYVRRHSRLQAADLPAGELDRIHRRIWAVPCVCLLAVALSYVSQPLARLSLLAIPFAVRLFDRPLRGRNVRGSI